MASFMKSLNICCSLSFSGFLLQNVPSMLVEIFLEVDPKGENIYPQFLIKIILSQGQIHYT